MKEIARDLHKSELCDQMRGTHALRNEHQQLVIGASLVAAECRYSSRKSRTHLSANRRRRRCVRGFAQRPHVPVRLPHLSSAVLRGATTCRLPPAPSETCSAHTRTCVVSEAAAENQSKLSDCCKLQCTRRSRTCFQIVVSRRENGFKNIRGFLRIEDSHTILRTFFICNKHK